MSKAFYNYGINDIGENKDNKEILDVNFGHGKFPLHIWKKDIMDFVKAVISKEEVEDRGITPEKLQQSLKEDGVAVLNYLLGGRSMILITNTKNYLDYKNAGQSIQQITGLNLDGEIEMENAFDYIARSPKYSDLHPSKGKKAEKIREDDDAWPIIY